MLSGRSAHRPLLWLFVVSAVLRVVVLLAVYSTDPERLRTPDSESYLSPAEALVERHQFLSSAEPSAGPEVKRTPGYPLFIAMSYRVTGAGERSMLVLQAIACTAIIAVTGLMAGRLWGDWAVVPAALMLALDPLTFLYSHLVLSDGLFALVFACHCAAVMRLLQSSEREPAWAALSGLLLAAATYIRPIAYYFVPVLLLLVVWSFRKRGRRWTSALAVCLAIAGTWLPATAAWQWRNLRVAGVSDFSAIEGINLLLWRGAGIVASLENVPFEEAQDELRAAMSIDAPDDDAVNIALYKREGLRLIREHPLLMLKDQLRGVGRTVFGPGVESFRIAYGSAGRLVAGYSAAYLCLLYVSVAAGLFAAWRSGMTTRPEFLFLWAAALYLLVVAAGPEAYSRFRVPLMPVLAVTAPGAWQLWRKANRNADTGANPEQTSPVRRDVSQT